MGQHVGLTKKYTTWRVCNTSYVSKDPNVKEHYQQTDAAESKDHKSRELKMCTRTS